MKRIRVWTRCFLQMLVQIKNDPMLFMVCFAPVFAGAVFRFGIPALEQLLCREFEKEQILQPYYTLIDISFCFMAPMLFSYASAMVILTERDEKTANYYFVTPVGKKGYLIGRLVIPSILGTVVTFLLLPLFHVSELSAANGMIYALGSGLLGGIVSLLIVSLSSNRVEGMAITKLSGLLIVGLIIPFFVDGKASYLAAVMPSYWLGRYAVKPQASMIGMLIASSLIWIWYLSKRFMKKLV